jgi:hypothetical protein
MNRVNICSMLTIPNPSLPLAMSTITNVAMNRNPYLNSGQKFLRASGHIVTFQLSRRFGAKRLLASGERIGCRHGLKMLDQASLTGPLG